MSYADQEGFLEAILDHMLGALTAPRTVATATESILGPSESFQRSIGNILCQGSY